MAAEPDFRGYVTKYEVRCTDGRKILKHAFQEQDGAWIPLVYQHQHADIGNVLGRLILRHKDDGMYAEGFFNETPNGKNAKIQVRHGDLTRLSIYANQLVQKGMDVLHGVIKEGSLVLAGANPGARIDFINFQHADGMVTESEDEAIISFDLDLEIMHADEPDPLASSPAKGTELAVTHAVGGMSNVMPNAGNAGGDMTVQDVIDSMNDIQKNVLFGLVGAASSGMSQDSTSDGQTDTVSHDTQRGDPPVTRNVFDQSTREQDQGQPGAAVLSHADLESIFAAARKGGSLKDAVDEFAVAHSITNIDYMFPDAKTVTDTPDWISRRQDWVNGVLSGTRHTPFSRIKNMMADITLDEARARGYVKGAMKREEFFAIAKRTTTPQTIYKKQKLDRDDIVDITDFDVVAWLKAEMRLMLDEEVARAVLIGDGRDVADPDKINEANIRPILTDSDVYVTTVNVDLVDASSSPEEIVDGVLTAMQYFLGTGQPTLYAARSWITKMLLVKDSTGRRLRSNMTELANDMGVGNIVPVDVFETVSSSLLGIVVNLADYTIGSDRGGEVNFFDDFDIDYNKFTYLYETRLSGALTKFKSAIVIKPFSGAGGMLPDPTPPTFVKATGVVTVPTTANVTYVTVNDSTGVESGAVTAGAQAAIAAGSQVHYRAKAASTYSFANNAANNWTFQRPAP